MVTKFKSMKQATRLLQTLHPAGIFGKEFAERLEVTPVHFRKINNANECLLVIRHLLVWDGDTPSWSVVRLFWDKENLLTTTMKTFNSGNEAIKFVKKWKNNNE